MNDDMVQVWLYDTTDKNKLTGTTMVPRGSELLVGQTYIKPESGLYGTPMFDEDLLRWHGISKEEWEKTNPYNGGLQTGPSERQVLMADLMKQNADLKQQVQNQAVINASIMKSVADLKKQSKEG